MKNLHNTLRRFLAPPNRSVVGLRGGVVLLAGVALTAMGCGGAPSGPSSSSTAGAGAAPISWTHFDVGEPPAPSAELLARGEQVYKENCAACHGDQGDGTGLCAAFLLPHPRNFTTGVFRFKTTPGGQMPTDQDLFRTVSLGLHSTGMPPWKFLLPEEDRWAVVEYIKGFAPAFASEGPGESVDLGPEPEITTERIAAGRELYVTARCAKCHGENGYGDGPSARTLIDAFGNPIPPRNYHKTGHFKRGHTVRDIALTIHTGNNGTPMPAFDGAFTPDEIWSIAAYVYSLGEQPLSRWRYAGGCDCRRGPRHTGCRDQAHGAELEVHSQRDHRHPGPGGAHRLPAHGQVGWASVTASRSTVMTASPSSTALSSSVPSR